MHLPLLFNQRAIFIAGVEATDCNNPVDRWGWVATVAGVLYAPR